DPARHHSRRRARPGADAGAAQAGGPQGADGAPGATRRSQQRGVAGAATGGGRAGASGKGGVRGKSGDAVAIISAVIPREGGESSTPRPTGLITVVSGVLDRPPQCASAHKAGDDRGGYIRNNA